MKRPSVAIMSFVLVLALSQTARSSIDIVYYNDHSVGTDRMAAALAAVSGTYNVTTASSLADFATKVASGTYEMGIFAQQNSSGAAYDAAFSALATHIAGGGLAIANDWTQNNAHALPFQASFTFGTNQPSFTVTHASLLPGISNPVNLSNPGWGVFAMDEATLGGGVAAATFPNTAAAIVLGNSGRTFFNGFLTDTFTDGAEGVQLYVNEINFLANGVQPVVPEAASVAIWMLLGMTYCCVKNRGR